MQLADKAVDVICKQLVKKYRYNFDSDPKKLAGEYKKRKAQIVNLYKKANYWHGSGRYHYQHNGRSKYHAKYTEEVEDVLEAVIARGGLEPKFDFWTGLSTISLTKHRVHARAYAQFHQYEHRPLEYEYGSTKFWYFTLATKLAFTNDLWHNLNQTRKINSNEAFNEKMRQWAGYVRKNTALPPISVLNFYKLRSDIRKNYGILFGIRRAGVKEVAFNPTVERFEVRSDRPIGFEQMTHVEVPREKEAETKGALERRGIDLPVVPMELGEIYINEIGIDRLAE